MLEKIKNSKQYSVVNETESEKKLLNENSNSTWLIRPFFLKDNCFYVSSRSDDRNINHYFFEIKDEKILWHKSKLEKILYSRLENFLIDLELKKSCQPSSLFNQCTTYIFNHYSIFSNSIDKKTELIRDVNIKMAEVMVQHCDIISYAVKLINACRKNYVYILTSLVRYSDLEAKDITINYEDYNAVITTKSGTQHITVDQLICYAHIQKQLEDFNLVSENKKEYGEVIKYIHEKTYCGFYLKGDFLLTLPFSNTITANARKIIFEQDLGCSEQVISVKTSELYKSAVQLHISLPILANELTSSTLLTLK